MPLQQNFPGVDAIMYPPLLLFQYSVNGKRKAGSDEALLKMMCTMAEKYELDSGTGRQQTPFFYVVPDDKLLKFRLPRASTIAPVLAKQACDCQVPSRAELKTRKRKMIDGDSEASGSPQEDSRCLYCRCLKYFHFCVMGMPGFVQEPEREFRLSADAVVVTIDRQGAFQACHQKAKNKVA